MVNWLADRGYLAAMEPARGERDDLITGISGDTLILPQWSPLVVSGMTLVSDIWRRVFGTAAMEPARGERDDVHSPVLVFATLVQPQWSPLVVSGMTLRSPQGPDPAAPAAMEPARGERDDAWR